MSLSNYKSVTKYIVSFSLLAIIILKMDMSALLEQSSHMNIWLLYLATVLVVCQILFLNMRWHLLINAGRQNIPFEISSLINISGYFANLLFITSVGGILAKSALAVRHGLSIVESVFATFLDRFMTLFALLLFAALGLPFLQNTLDGNLLTILSLLISGVIACVAVTLIVLRSGLLKDFILSSRRRSRIVAVLRSYTENYNLMLKTTLFSIGAQAAFVLSVFVLSLGLHDAPANAHVIEFLALMPVLMLIASLPISFGGWGIREGAFVLGLSLMGYSMESAFFLSVQVGLVTLIAPFIVALPYLQKTDIRTFLIKKETKTA